MNDVEQQDDNSPKLEGSPLIVPSTTEHPLYDEIVTACK